MSHQKSVALNMAHPYDLLGRLLKNQSLNPKKNLFLFDQDDFRDSGFNCFRTFYYSIFFVSHGESPFRVGSMGYTVRPGDILTIGPGETYQWDCLEDLCFDALVFNEEVIERIEKRSFFYSLDYFCPDQQRKIRPEDQSIQQVRSLFGTIKLFQDNLAVIPGLLQSFLVLLDQLDTKGKAPTPEGRQGKNIYVSAFREKLAKNIRRHRDVSFYAASLNISPKRLSDVLLTETGWTAKKWIENHLRVEAESLLCYSDMPIKQVAHRLGFEDISYFTKTFKKWTGRSPAAFRTQNS